MPITIEESRLRDLLLGPVMAVAAVMGEKRLDAFQRAMLRYMYIALNLTQRPADFLNTLQNAALNLPPSEMRALAEWLARTADETEEKFRDQKARALRK